MKIEGNIFAIVTPFNAKGEVSYPALTNYLTFLKAQGVKNILVNGTTGEFPSLTIKERMKILEYARITFDGIIVSHISSCALKDVRVLLKHSEKFANAVLVLPPYYYANVTCEGLFRFIAEVAKESSLPLFLYNFPRHTQNPISVDLLEKLKQYHNIAGIKDSGGDFSVSLSYRRCNPDLQVFVGSDRTALKVMSEGLDGSVTGSCNPTPEYPIKLREAFLSGNVTEAEKYQDKISKWSKFMNDLGGDSIPIIKAALKARIPNFPLFTRPPLMEVEQNIVAKVRSYLHEFGEVIT